MMVVVISSAHVQLSPQNKQLDPAIGVLDSNGKMLHNRTIEGERHAQDMVLGLGVDSVEYYPSSRESH